MTNKNNATDKEPGEKQPGKYHYNPGNMSGKEAEKVENTKDDRARVNSAHKKPASPNKQS